jgi:hypothetical protein
LAYERLDQVEAKQRKTDLALRRQKNENQEARAYKHDAQDTKEVLLALLSNPMISKKGREFQVSELLHRATAPLSRSQKGTVKTRAEILRAISKSFASIGKKMRQS